MIGRCGWSARRSTVALVRSSVLVRRWHARDPVVGCSSTLPSYWDSTGRSVLVRHLLLSTSVSPPTPPATAFFSTDAGSASSSSSVSSAGPHFKYPKARATFDKIVNSGMSADDVLKLTESVNLLLGRPVRDNEFYYRAFGGGGARGGAGASAATEEASAPPAPTTADVKLMGFDAASKIKVIKEVRSLLGLGLKEAKDLVEGAPKVLQKSLSIAAAEELRDKLLAAGAQVELV